MVCADGGCRGRRAPACLPHCAGRRATEYHRDADEHPDTDGDEHADAADEHPDADGDEHAVAADGHPDADGDEHPDRYADEHGDADRYAALGDADVDLDAVRDADGPGYAVADRRGRGIDREPDRAGADDARRRLARVPRRQALTGAGARFPAGRALRVLSIASAGLRRPAALHADRRTSNPFR